MEWKNVSEWRLGQLLSDALNQKRNGAQLESISDEEWMSLFFLIKYNKEEYDLSVLEEKHSPTRIPIIMKVIREYWKAHPNLTFSQIIATTLEKQHPGGKLYGARDSIWQTLILTETPLKGVIS
ncbi:hypothetical protein [Paenibacillus sp. LjRoot153]|uniref:hypothetical protein n=1 Tax=Paenibacillus sp. LjRoot153 TaxID=3342270 RepID=UPI003F50360E